MAHLNETKIDSTLLFDGAVIRVEKDHVRLEDGTVAFREVVRHPGGVCVLAVTDEDEILLVRQFRYPHDAVTTELPAGKLEAGESPETCGRRELLEECGCTAEEFTYLGKLFPTPAYDSEVIHMFLAQKLTFTQQSLDEGEFLEVERMPFEDAVQFALEDGCPDAKTQIAILRYFAWRQKKRTV